MIKLDVKDKKIIYELDIDGFQTNSSIAKKIKLSKQLVGYRIKSLQKNNIIKKVYPIIKAEKLGYEGQKVYFQMQNLNKENEKYIITYFNNHKNVIWFGIYEGRYDFVVSFFCKNKIEFDEILSKVLSDLVRFIVDFDIAIYIGVLALKKKYLAYKKTSEKFDYFGSSIKKEDINKLDMQILKLFCTDARIPYVKIANHLNISTDIVIAKLKKMKKNGLIQGSRVMLNKKKLGIHEFKLLLNLKKYDNVVHKKFIEFSKKEKYISAYIKCIGSWSIELDIEIPTLDEFHDLILSIKTEFADSIQKIETLMMYDEYKYNFYPFD